jgi:hypothetical protein
MSNPIQLPSIPSQQACYDSVRTQTPELWSEFEGQLLPLAQADKPAVARIQEISKREKEIWENFLENDTDRKSRVVKGAWSCCVGDLVSALVSATIPTITGSDETVENKRTQLMDLLKLVDQLMGTSFSALSIKVDLQSALNDLV